MDLREMVDQNRKQALLAVHHGNEAVLDLLKPFLTRPEPIWTTFDRPAVRESVERWFGFVDDLLKEEREFVLRVVDMLPEERTTRPVKTAPKAA